MSKATEHAGDRPYSLAAVVHRVVDSLGGSLECLYWMLGAFDGIAIAQLPSTVSAAALSAMLTSSGAFKTVQTHELLNQEQLAQTLQLASDAAPGYRRPDSPRSWPPVPGGAFTGTTRHGRQQPRHSCGHDRDGRNGR